MKIRPIPAFDQGFEETIEVALTKDEASILASLIHRHVGGISPERDFLTDEFETALVRHGASRFYFDHDGTPHGLSNRGASAVFIYGRLDERSALDYL